MADRKTWVKRVAAWRASGMTCREYAEREGLGPWRTLRWWVWRLERERQAKKPQLVRVVRAPEPEEVVVEPRACEEFHLRLAVSPEAVRLELAPNDLVAVLEGLAVALRAGHASKGST
jgi:hypothetical protein